MSGGVRKVLPDGRSDTRIKLHGGRGKKRIGEQFIAHTREMRRSIAWRHLTGNDKLVLERIEEEHMAHAGLENGRLHVTYADFEAAGVRRMSISTSIARVEALGFVECTDRGRASKAEFRFPASYRLTYVQGNAAPTNDWRAIANDDIATYRIAAAVHRLKDRSRTLSGKLHEKVAAKSAWDGFFASSENATDASSENATTVSVAFSLLPYRVLRGGPSGMIP